MLDLKKNIKDFVFLGLEIVLRLFIMCLSVHWTDIYPGIFGFKCQGVCEFVTFWVQVGWSSAKEYHTFVWVEPCQDADGQQTVMRQAVFKGKTVAHSEAGQREKKMK